ncbi:MAG: YkgJ family cysteine cluster protein [Flammeovirgaceae bacterium]|nr:MAG: YkgJ family cysteine cluster protein [Flammeovirgaceae bacterium]
MTLEEKVAKVEQVFVKLDAEITAFQQASGLNCPSGCGKCCFKADIEATVIEFLPFAMQVYKNGIAMEWHERLSRTDTPVCAILNPLQAGQGLCSEYKHRGLICRLFGYSARKNKYGTAELVTCEIIKDQAGYQAIKAGIESGEIRIPLMHDYYMQLYAIDMDLSREFYPINRALQKAIEEVLHYYAYRNAT